MKNSDKVQKLEIRELTFKNGLKYPSNAELIMLILGSGIKSMPIRQLAKQVLGIVTSSNDENLVDNLLKIKGMGKSKALMIAASLEFGKRMNKNPGVSLQTPSDVIPYIQNYAMQKQEHFICISLNGASEIISIRVICIGTSNMAIIRPAEVFAEAVKERASAVIICHNHPSGNTTPSSDDIKTTYKLMEAAETLGIAVLDHIIISQTNYFSFLEHDFLDDEKLYDSFQKSSEKSQLVSAPPRLS